MDRALDRGGNRIEAEQRAGRHDDRAAMRAGEVDQVRPRQKRASAEHHDAPASLKHWGADFLKGIRADAFDRKIGVAGKIVELDKRTDDLSLTEPRLGLGAVACRGTRELDP